MPKPNQKITVLGVEISIKSISNEEYISLSDILQAKDGDFFISDWLRNRNTLEFLGIWEKVNNPNFNYGEFAIIKNKAGLNSFKISIKEWTNKTKAIGIKANTGRYGGTYAHKDIAFEFGMWISPEFKIYLIKEFQRLKDLENQNQISGWSVSRILSKLNYKIHTDAIKKHITPPMLSENSINIIYANEADVLNVALFGMTAKDWRLHNAEKDGNIRDYASIEQLVVLSNLESLNAEFIKSELSQKDRLIRLNKVAIDQIELLIGDKTLNKLQQLVA
jgi:hypothetical protein